MELILRIITHMRYMTITLFVLHLHQDLFAVLPLHIYIAMEGMAIRENPDHATFREKEHTPVFLDKLGVSLSLSLCNLAKFDDLYLRRYRHY